MFHPDSTDSTSRPNFNAQIDALCPQDLAVNATRLAVAELAGRTGFASNDGRYHSATRGSPINTGCSMPYGMSVEKCPKGFGMSSCTHKNGDN